MGLTLSENASGVFGNLGYWMGTATFDAAYAVAGESLTPADLRLKNFAHISITPDQLTTTTALIPIWDDSAEKILLMEANDDAEAFIEPGTDDVSALIVYIWALGTVREYF